MSSSSTRKRRRNQVIQTQRDENIMCIVGIVALVAVGVTACMWFALMIQLQH